MPARIWISDEIKEAIIVLHTKNKLVPHQISKKLVEMDFHISTSALKQRLLEWGVYDPNVADESKYAGSRRPKSDETKEKMRQASLERWSRKDGSIGFLGRTHSPETYKHWTPFTSRGEFQLKEKLERKGYKQGYKFSNLAVFDFYHEKWKIAVEVDGSYHFGMYQSDVDKSRDNRMLKFFGIRTIRINEETMKIYSVTKRME